MNQTQVRGPGNLRFEAGRSEAQVTCLLLVLKCACALRGRAGHARNLWDLSYLQVDDNGNGIRHPARISAESENWLRVLENTPLTNTKLSSFFISPEGLY